MDSRLLETPLDCFQHCPRLPKMQAMRLAFHLTAVRLRLLIPCSLCCWPKKKAVFLEVLLQPPVAARCDKHCNSKNMFEILLQEVHLPGLS